RILPFFQARASRSAGTNAGRDDFGALLGPGRVLDDIHEVGPLETGYEAFEDVRIDVAEGGLGPGGDPFREGLEDAALEVRPRVQRSDLCSLRVSDVVVADS